MTLVPLYDLRLRLLVQRALAVRMPIRKGVRFLDCVSAAFSVLALVSSCYTHWIYQLLLPRWLSTELVLVGAFSLGKLTVPLLQVYGFLVVLVTGPLVPCFSLLKQTCVSQDFEKYFTHVYRPQFVWFHLVFQGDSFPC